MMIMTFLYFISLFKGSDPRRLVWGVWSARDFIVGGLYCIIVSNQNFIHKYSCNLRYHISRQCLSKTYLNLLHVLDVSSPINQRSLWPHGNFGHPQKHCLN